MTLRFHRNGGRTIALALIIGALALILAALSWMGIIEGPKT